MNPDEGNQINNKKRKYNEMMQDDELLADDDGECKTKKRKQNV